MGEVASRKLRNQTRALLDRVAGGETVSITLHGRPIAELRPADSRTRWMKREQFVRDVLSHQADAGLADDLNALAGETTDDLPWS